MKAHGLILLALLSMQAQALDLGTIKDLKQGQIAGVDYKVGTKALRLKGAWQSMEAAAKIGYDGNMEVTLAKRLSEGRMSLALKEHNGNTRVFFHLETKF